jgi:hypothetical protein
MADGPPDIHPTRTMAIVDWPLQDARRTTIAVGTEEINELY